MISFCKYKTMTLLILLVRICLTDYLDMKGVSNTLINKNKYAYRENGWTHCSGFDVYGHNTWDITPDVSLVISRFHRPFSAISNHQPHDCLLNRLFRHRSKKTSKPCVTGLCAGNSPATDEFPAQRASNAGNVSIWWRHHELCHP